MCNDEPEVEIESFSEPLVVVPWGDDKPFKLIGSGFSKKTIDTFVCTNEHGNDVVPKITVTIDPNARSTDNYLSVIAHAEPGADTEKVFWVAVKLNGMFQDAQEGLKVI
ncbi:hypothetical protein [Rhizobium hidalgonense]|uniref:hypothetical protein n=1 Tax=Rhizobium hidalgonense TaxID=1538159 RepID=UPI00027D3D76|nr:hypothetical protein [Rhizobium hidalgonense]EJC72078.1 hypothetical protein Rleg10DRAFT_0478 [Rhizobium leguminosarum bv. trifolii WSM2012]QKK26082.1 hypothetical protein FFM81_022105 [Rhizobium hidalgonense]RWX18531.1 hypothetical protein EHI42_06755 [Rhizobium hidalgonense]